MAILLSVAINVLMLVTWNARTSLGTPGIHKNETYIPPDIHEYVVY